MTQNKAPEQGGEKEFKGLLKTIVTVASKSWDAAVLHTRDVSSHPPAYPNKQTFINNLSKDFAADHRGGYTVEEILAWYQGKGDEYREQTLLSDCAKDYIQSLKH